MSPEVMQIVIPALTAITASLGTFFATRSNNTKDVTLNARKSLSEDEKAFRKELRDSINGYKQDLDESREEIRKLSVEVAELHKINFRLTLDNKDLQEKVDDLRAELQSFRDR